MRYKLCLIEKTLLYHKADNSEKKYKFWQYNLKLDKKAL